jgi:methylated-DNA-[protein]-cysteine S-methyltransferase
MITTVIDTPIGRIGLEADAEALTQITFHARSTPDAAARPTGVLAEASRQLDAYFAKRLRAFDLPLAPSGTPFQLDVWHALETIPYGETWTYADLARRVGRPAAIRAVGAANGRHPIPIVIPCHRVIGSNGKLVGFGGGLPVKQFLLELERPGLLSQFRGSGSTHRESPKN